MATDWTDGRLIGLDEIWTQSRLDERPSAGHRIFAVSAGHAAWVVTGRRSSRAKPAAAPQLADEARVLLVEVRARRLARLEHLARARHAGARRRRRARRRVRPPRGSPSRTRARCCSGRPTTRPSASARSWHHARLRVAPPVRLSSPSVGGAEPRELLEAQPLDERHALHERGGMLGLVARAAEHEGLRRRAPRRESARRARRADRRARVVRSCRRRAGRARRGRGRGTSPAARRRRCSTRHRAASRRRASGASRRRARDRRCAPASSP